MAHAHEMQYELFNSDGFEEVSVQVVVPASSSKRKKYTTSCVMAFKIAFGTLAIFVLVQILCALRKIDFRSIIKDVREEVYSLISEASTTTQPQESAEAYFHSDDYYSSYALFEDDTSSLDDETKMWINSYEPNDDDSYFKERSYFNEYYYPTDDSDNPSTPTTVWVLDEEVEDGGGTYEEKGNFEMNNIGKEEQKEIEDLRHIMLDRIVDSNETGNNWFGHDPRPRKNKYDTEDDGSVLSRLYLQKQFARMYEDGRGP